MPPGQDKHGHLVGTARTLRKLFWEHRLVSHPRAFLGTRGGWQVTEEKGRWFLPGTHSPPHLLNRDVRGQSKPGEGSRRCPCHTAGLGRGGEQHGTGHLLPVTPNKAPSPFSVPRPVPPRSRRKSDETPT